MKKIVLIFSTVLLTPVLALTQVFTREKVVEDLKFLKDNMETYHPGIGTYNPDFDRQSDSLIGSVDGTRSLFEYFGLLSKLVAMGNEGHYSVGSWQDTVHRGFGNGEYRYMPFSVRIIDDRLYVWDHYLEEDLLNRGDMILSINGTPAMELISELYPYVSSDGHIKTSKNYKLNSTLPWMYYLFIGQPDTFNMSVRKVESDREVMVSVPALTFEEMKTNYRNSRSNYGSQRQEVLDAGEVYEFRLTGKTAFLTLKSFSRSKIEKHKLNAKKLYRDIFRELKEEQVENLVLDLRGNNGGRDEFSRHILPYIQKENSREVYKVSTSWKGKSKTYKLPHKSKWAFSGTIYVIVDGGSFSAASAIARFINEYNDPVIVGEEAAGRYEGFVAGSKQYVVLPNSGIRIGIPRYNRSYPASEKQPTKNRGLIPDFEVTPGIGDLIDGRDVAMEYVGKLIAGR